VTLELRYDTPAQDWERESLPIGNGFEGAGVFGGISDERLVLSEKTLWTGGPGGEEPYRHGLWESSPLPALAQVRRELAGTEGLEPAHVASILGAPSTGYGASQVFAEVRIGTGHDESDVTGYARGLDLATATAWTRYTLGATTFGRDVIASNPDRVIVARLTADGPAGVDAFVRVLTSDGRSREVTATADGLVVAGALHDNGMRYQLTLRVVTDGSVSVEGEHLRVTGADEVVVVIALATDYALRFPGFRGELPDVTARADAAAAIGYAELKARHVADHAALFDRFALELTSPSDAPEPTTPELLAGYPNHSAADRLALDELVVAYGRYLLIASSRPGALPAHLQGLWNSSTTPPWSCDFHVNINEQMNYWPALRTGLAEVAEPYYAFTAFLAETTGALLAEQLDVRGWSVLLATTPFAYAGVIEYATSFWFPEANAWLAHDIAEAVRSTGSESLLVDIARPVIHGVAAFWLDLLVEDPRDQTLVVSPSYSPEHGAFTVGAAMSGQLVHAVFVDALELLDPDDEVRTEVAKAVGRLDIGLRVGSWGQLQEWKTDLDDPDDHHRHVSQLFALFPGDSIDAADSAADRAALRGAAATTLDARGNDGPGWCQAWRSALRARLHDGDAAYGAFGRLVGDNLLPNLWGNHPPFQIDANFGATAAAVEMLVQSHEDWTGRDGQSTIRLLPALPSAWPAGNVRGVVTRAGATVDMAWRDGAPTSVRIEAGHPHAVRILGPGLGEITADVAPGRPFSWTARARSGSDRGRG
jgi:alpha-L-fucosidase 2